MALLDVILTFRRNKMKKVLIFCVILALVATAAYNAGCFYARKRTKSFINFILKYEMQINAKTSYTNANYDKSETILLEDFLYAKDAPENWKHLSLNDNGDVIYNGKVIVNDNFEPINNTTSYSSYLLLKIYMIAEGAVPRENCDTSDTATNGIYGLGCYVLETQ